MMGTSKTRRSVTALASLERQNPGAYELACAASLAARVEPELMRALRIELLPDSDPSAEADLWWSRVVHVRGATAVTFTEDAQRELRERLLALPELASTAYRIIRRVHRTSPSLLRLEEALTWHAIFRPNDHRGLERILRPAVALILSKTERRAEVAVWSARALPRLPEAVRRTQLYWVLLFATNRALPGEPLSIDRPQAIPFHELPNELFRDVPDVYLELRRSDSGIALRKTLSPTSLKCPGTSPVVVELRADGQASVQVIEDSWVEYPCSGRANLATLDGREYAIAPRITATAVGVAEHHAPQLENGRWILIECTEQHTDSNRDLVIRVLGQALARSGFSLITATADYSVIAAHAFEMTLIRHGHPSALHRLLQLSLAGEPTPSHGRVLPSSSPVVESVARAHAVLSFGPPSEAAAVAPIPRGQLLDPKNPSELAPLPPMEWTELEVERYAGAIVEALKAKLNVEAPTLSEPLIEVLQHAEYALAERDLEAYNDRLNAVDSGTRHVDRKTAVELAQDYYRPSFRLLGYRASSRPPPEAVLAALRAERQTVMRCWETRTLWLLLRAIRASGPPEDPALARAVAAGCAAMQTLLLRNPRVDSGGQCKDSLELLSKRNETTKRALQLSGMAREYEQLRERLTSSNERTGLLDELMKKMAKHVATDPPVTPEAGAWFWGGTPGERMLALMLLLKHPAPEGFPIVQSALSGSESAFEQYYALRVADAMALALAPEARVRLQSLAQNLRFDLAQQSQSTGSARLQLAADILAKIGRFDLPESTSSWLSVGLKRVRQHLRFRLAWPPNQPIQIGSVGHLKGELFLPVTTLREFELDWEVDHTTLGDFTYASEGAARTTDRHISHAHFERAGDGIVYGSEVVSSAIRHMAPIAAAIDRLIQTKRWDPSWVFVTDQLLARELFFAVANERDAQLSFARTEFGNITVIASSGLGVVSVGTGSLYKLGQFKRGLFRRGGFRPIL